MTEILHNMDMTRCPYDMSLINVRDLDDSTYEISCSHCGAKWEANNALVKRVSEHNWELTGSFQNV